jgi:hypothetical protein
MSAFDDEGPDAPRTTDTEVAPSFERFGELTDADERESLRKQTLADLENAGPLTTEGPVHHNDLANDAQGFSAQDTVVPYYLGTDFADHTPTPDPTDPVRDPDQ